MNKLVISNLIHRPLRSAISVTAIAIEVTLILLIVGLSLGMLRDSAERTKGIGAGRAGIAAGFLVSDRNYRRAGAHHGS